MVSHRESLHNMKERIRKETIKKRDAISPDTKTAKDLSIKQRLFSLHEFVQAEIVFFYASFRSEVDTHTMIKESLEMGKRVMLPRVHIKGHKVKLYEIKDINELSPGHMGIPEPSFSEAYSLLIDEANIIIIPGVAFDYSGNRLGYGGGYYDMILTQRKKESPIIALAYEEQLVDEVPSEPHDIKFDLVVTDKRIIKP
jgi:5-formyltetrahydrofolate cyclo-ligase